jgi:WD40 repeat protein
MRSALILLLAAAAAAQDRTISAEAEVRTVAFSKDGGTLVGLCGDRKLRQWDLRSGSLRKTTPWGEDEHPAALPSGSGVLAMGGKDGTIVLTGLDDGTAVRRISAGQRPVNRVAVAGEARAIAGSNRVPGNSREEVMRLWDASGTERFEAPAGIGGTSALSISPDGSILVAGSWDTNVRAWSTRNGELLRLIEDLPVAMFGIAFTPDGRSLAAAGVDRTVYFWDIRTWKLERKLIGQPEMISSLAFSPDGRLLATGGFNDITQKHPVSILLWDVASGKVLRTLPSPHMVASVAFSPDGKLLAATGGDNTVRLWTIAKP